jgi:GTP-binding protein
VGLGIGGWGLVTQSPILNPYLSPAVLEAQFVLSAAGRADFPTDGIPEVALVGRSNVGKSSLINALTQQTLARTSAAPGKTRLVNYYLIKTGVGVRDSGLGNSESRAPKPQSRPGARSFLLVDLPGYGYARGGADARQAFEALTREYFEAGLARIRGARREPLVAGVLHMIDARHPELPQDATAHTWLTGLGVPLCTLATKMDKLTSSARLRVAERIEAVYGPPIVTTSASTGEGLKEVWKVIREWTA